MDGESGEVIVSHTRDRRNYGLSAQAMEPFLTKEILTYLKENGLNFASIAHDDNKAVGKLVQEHVNPDNTKPLDQLDCWHYVKLLLKVVVAFLKVRSGVRSLIVTTVLNFKLVGLKRLAATLLLVGLKKVMDLQKQIDLAVREAQFLESQRFTLGLPGRGMSFTDCPSALLTFSRPAARPKWFRECRMELHIYVGFRRSAS